MQIMPIESPTIAQRSSFRGVIRSRALGIRSETTTSPAPPIKKRQTESSAPATPESTATNSVVAWPMTPKNTAP